MLKLGKKCTWEEIEVGEVFAAFFISIKDFVVEIKTKNELNIPNTFCLSEFLDGLDFSGETNTWRHGNYNLYKLPKSSQRLWITEE